MKAMVLETVGRPLKLIEQMAPRPRAHKVLVEVAACAVIHMSLIRAMPYDLLWGGRVIRSIASLTRQDGQEFMDMAATISLQIAVEPFALEQANEAVKRLREGNLTAAAVLVPDRRNAA